MPLIPRALRIGCALAMSAIRKPGTHDAPPALLEQISSCGEHNSAKQAVQFKTTRTSLETPSHYCTSVPRTSWCIRGRQIT